VASPWRRDARGRRCQANPITAYRHLLEPDATMIEHAMATMASAQVFPKALRSMPSPPPHHLGAAFRPHRESGISLWRPSASLRQRQCEPA